MQKVAVQQSCLNSPQDIALLESHNAERAKPQLLGR